MTEIVSSISYKYFPDSFEKEKANVCDSPQIWQLIKEEYFIETIYVVQERY